MIAFTAFEFESDAFWSAILIDNLCGDGGAVHEWGSDLGGGAVVHEENLDEADIFVDFDSEFLDVDFVAFLDAVLFTTGFDYCVGHLGNWLGCGAGSLVGLRGRGIHHSGPSGARNFCKSGRVLSGCIPMGDESICKTPAEMYDLGRKLGEKLQKGDCVALCGPLGAGKTQFVKGLAAGLGFSGEVTSPTFSLLHEYRGGQEALFHLDFYRIEAEAELLDLGWDDLLEEGVVVAEWANKFRNLLPRHTKWFEISSLGEEGRRVCSGLPES